MLVTSTLFSKVCDVLKTQSLFFIDTETDGLHPYQGNKIFGIGIGIASGKVYYFPFKHKYPSSDNLSEDDLSTLISILNKSASHIVGYNVKFDLHMLMKEGLIPWDKQLIDVLVAVRLTEDDRALKMGLLDIIDKYYGKENGDYDRNTKLILKKNKWNKDFSLAPIDTIGPYCEKDVEWTRQIYVDRILTIKNTNQLKVWNIEIDLTKVLLKMECIGISIDNEYCKNALYRIKNRQENLSKDIYEHVNKEFDILSSQQVGEVFKSLGIEAPEKTKLGNPSWNETSLYQIDHPMAVQIRGYRSLDKLRGTYLEPFVNADVLHTSFCNWGTITGRLSSRDPNLQNIPRSVISIANTISEEQSDEIKERIEAMVQARKGQTHNIVGGTTLRTIVGFTSEDNFDENNIDQISIRRMFKPRPGFKLVTYDYSQMEARVFISYCNNKTIIKKMNQEGFDFHTEAAKIAFKVEESNPQFNFFRQMGKAVTFGILYGIGIKRLAAQLNKSEEEAREYRRKYFDNIEGSEHFIKSATRKAEQQGYITNRLGRRYVLPLERSYVAVNYLIQGTSADILSSRMIVLDDYLSQIDGRILIQIHDEVLCELPEDSYLDISKNVKRILEENEFDIPLIIDTSLCDPYWSSKKKIKV